MNGDVKNFDILLGNMFPAYTDIVAEISDRSVTMRLLKMIVESGLVLHSFIPVGKANKRFSQIIEEGTAIAFCDQKSQSAYRVGLPLRVMVARFPAMPTHNFIRINYAGVESLEDRNREFILKNNSEGVTIKIKALECPGWLAVYPSGSLLADQRLEKRVRDLVVNGRDSVMLKEFMEIDEKRLVNSSNIELIDYIPEDAKLWEQWMGNMDTNLFQTVVRPQNFSAAKGRSEDYYLKIISYGSRKIGAVWVEKISQRTATGELGLIIGEPRFWGMGLGGRAISEMISIAKNDLRLQFLWVSVRESNQRAVSCYKKGGFSIVRRAPVYRPDGSYNMWVHMEKLI
ncbi:MAG: GNAT family N-acetyltransferase [Bacillota bacterium]